MQLRQQIILGLLISLVIIKMLDFGVTLARTESNRELIMENRELIQRSNRQAALRFKEARERRAPCDLTDFVFKPE